MKTLYPLVLLLLLLGSCDKSEPNANAQVTTQKDTQTATELPNFKDNRLNQIIQNHNDLADKMVRRYETVDLDKSDAWQMDEEFRRDSIRFAKKLQVVLKNSTAKDRVLLQNYIDKQNQELLQQLEEIKHKRLAD